MLDKISAAVLRVGVVLATPSHALAQQTPPPVPAQPPRWYEGPGPWHMWGDGAGGHFWWMPIMMILFLLIVCGAIAWFLCARRHGGGWMPHCGPFGHGAERAGEPPTHSALQILNERFARGEIPKDEYEEKRATILSTAQR